MNLKFMRGMNLREQKKCGILVTVIGKALLHLSERMKKR